jgi:dTDP-4-dehydrorhamnose 3,5-epimerase
MAFAFSKLDIPGLLLIRPGVFQDARGFFCETYKRSEFAANGISVDFVQDNHSLSTRGVIRGLHYQLPPFPQGKLVSVTSGHVWDIAVDIRPGSPTFGKWVAVELSDENNHLLWIPSGFAHGFIALSNAVHLVYKCTSEYHKESEAGIRWNDPGLGIRWPLENVVISEKDAALPLLKNARLP